MTKAAVEITCVNCIAMSSEMRAETDNIIYQGRGAVVDHDKSNVKC